MLLVPTASDDERLAETVVMEDPSRFELTDNELASTDVTIDGPIWVRSRYRADETVIEWSTDGMDGEHLLLPLPPVPWADDAWLQIGANQFDDQHATTVELEDFTVEDDA